MSNTTEQKARPAYHIFSVTKSEAGKSVFAEIGAAWPNKDGQGFNLYFKARPLKDAQIVLRAPKPVDDKKSSRRMAGRYDQLNLETSGD